MGDLLFLLLRRLRAPLITLIAVYAISIAGMVAIPGVDAEGRPWRMGFFHALYVMSYTATTIGFGEIPYPFTDAQRLWVTLAIYLSVIGWAYAFGSLFALSQDATFRSAAARSLFLNRVARMREPYVVICGYGRSGSAIARALDDLGVRLVVVDADRARVAPIDVQPFAVAPLVLVADARRPEVLRDAGIAKPECRAVLALTGDEEANQSIAIGTRVLDPNTRVIARITDAVLRSNLEEFGGVQVVDPFQAFARNVRLDFAAPEALQLEEWLTGAPGTQRREAMQLPRGHWVLAGYGRFSRPLAAALTQAGQSWRAFDPRFEPPDVAEGAVQATGATEAGLREAGIGNAVGVIAGTDSDSANLAVVKLARRLNPGVVVIARRNKGYNQALLDAAAAAVTFEQDDVMVHEVLQALTTPLLERFLEVMRDEGGPTAGAALQRLQAAFGDRVPFVWSLECDPTLAGFARARRDGLVLRVADLLVDPREPGTALAAVPLLCVRQGGDAPSLPGGAAGAPGPWRAWSPRRAPRRGTSVLDREGVGLGGARGDSAFALPAPDVPLEPGDRLLFAGAEGVEALQQRLMREPQLFETVRTGVEPARSWVFRRLAARRTL